MKKGLLIILSGFSGAGKGTAVRKLLEKYPEDYILSVSATTRKPREGELHGVHYFFCEEEEFREMIVTDSLLEYAGYVGHYYGTPRAFVETALEEGKDVILEIEIQGALKVKEKFPDAVLLFMTPPSVAELKARLIHRGTETEEVIAGRLARAIEEADGCEAYDYLIINDDIDECVEELHQLIRAEHKSMSRNAETINRIRNELSEYQKGEMK